LSEKRRGFTEVGPAAASRDVAESIRNAGSQISASLVSDHATAMAILPPMSSRLEYEVTVLHPHMYPQARETINGTNLPVTHDLELACFGLAEMTYFQHGKETLVAMGPASTPTCIDSRLRRLRISYWTQVPVTDAWATQALSLYFATDHAVAMLIDADLFIGDLVDQKTDFCSPLLLSSLMFWASVSITLACSHLLHRNSHSEARHVTV
jgi:hypothetical protein